MLLRIVRARAIKEGVIRCNLELNEVDEGGAISLVGEYDVAIDVSEMVLVNLDANDISVDLTDLQNALTQSVQHLLITGVIASQIEGLDWKIDGDIDEKCNIANT